MNSGRALFGRIVIVFVMVAGAIVAGPDVTSARAASADRVYANDHCYLIGEWLPNGTAFGGFGQLESNCLLLSDWSPQNPYVASNEAWIETDSNPAHKTWVETGIGYGGPVYNAANSPQGIGNRMALFMASSYPSGSGTQYLEQDAPSVAHGGVVYNFDIYKVDTGSNYWSTLLSGPDGNSWDWSHIYNGPRGVRLMAGNEFQTANDGRFRTYSRVTGLGFYDGNNSPHAGWANAADALHARTSPAGLTAIAVSGNHQSGTATHGAC